MKEREDTTNKQTPGERNRRGERKRDKNDGGERMCVVCCV